MSVNLCEASGVNKRGIHNETLNELPKELIMSQEDLFAQKITSYLKEGETLTPNLENRLALAREKALLMRKKETVQVNTFAPALTLSGIKGWVNQTSGWLFAGGLVLALTLFKFSSLFALYPTQEELAKETPAYQLLNKTLGSWSTYEKNMEDDLSSLDAYVLYQDSQDDDDTDSSGS